MANFAKTYSNRRKLVPHLEAWFERGKFPDTIPFEIGLNKERDTAFHPSSDAMRCLREAYALKKGDLEAEEISGTLHKIFHVGHVYHAWIQHIIVEELGFSTWDDVETEHRVGCDGVVLNNDDDWREDPKIAELLGAGGWWARGFADVAHCHIPKHGDHLIDIKTVNDVYFRSMPEHVKAGYEVQCQLYMHWHKQKHAMLLLVQKGTPHDFKEIHFTYDPQIIEGVYERWDTLAAALAENEPPECDCITPDKCVARDLYMKV
jgi:hypothetical protein